MSDYDGLTIVTPSFEKHILQFESFLASVAEYCTDPEFLTFNVVVEQRNVAAFTFVRNAFSMLKINLISTESILSRFSINKAPADLLRQVGKFTFQTIKKFGGLLEANTEWALVMDSETLFHSTFSARSLLNNYASQKYVFYTETQPRGATWKTSLGHEVTINAGKALGFKTGSRWYMESFHWFYETSKARELINDVLGERWLDNVRNSTAPVNYFENILYYCYLEQHYSSEYKFIDFASVLRETLPSEISARFNLQQLPLALFGNDYLLNIITPEEVKLLSPLFERFKLGFIRLEPPVLDHRYVQELKKLPYFAATVSSHHMIWLRGRVAVCVSGEFRHDVHRTPEQQIRHLVGFLSGVDCDVFVHGWSNTSEANIIHQLRPKAYLFEPKPDFGDLAARIRITEARIKEGRDEGSLAMFYGMRQAFRLISAPDDYEYVVRIRPDLFVNRSLKELMFNISDNGDLLRHAIYVPRNFQSKGVNDQFALGPTVQMARYFATFVHAQEHIDELPFNPEFILLDNLLAHDVEIAVLDMPYSLMRAEPMRIETVNERLHDQERTWWSSTTWIPPLVDVTDFFRDRLRSSQAILGGELSGVINVTPVQGKSHGTRIRLEVKDWNPVLNAVAFFKKAGVSLPSPFRIAGAELSPSITAGERYVFARPENGTWVVSQWEASGSNLHGSRIVCEAVPSGSVALDHLLGDLALRCGKVTHMLRGDILRLGRRFKALLLRYWHLIMRG